MDGQKEISSEMKVTFEIIMRKVNVFAALCMAVVLCACGEKSETNNVSNQKR